MQKSHYASCIRIGGIPILPPLMTLETRNEMRKYRDLAIGVEQKLSKRHNSITQSETNDSKSDPVTSINLSASDTSKTNMTSSVRFQTNQQLNSPKAVGSDNVNTETDNDNDQSLNRSVRKNSYTLEAPSPQLIALLRSNQIKDVSYSQDSNSESLTEVSRLSNSTKKQPSTSNECSNVSYNFNHSNNKIASMWNASAASLSSEYDSLSSDVESIVNLTDSVDPYLKEKSSSMSVELPKLESLSQDEPAPNQFPDNTSLKSFDSDTNLDVSKIKDLKLSSPQNSWESIKCKKRSMNLDLRKAFLKKTGVDSRGGSSSLPTSLCSSPEPKHLFHSTEDISKEHIVSRIPLSTKIQSRYHKLSEKSQCSFKNTTMRNHLNEAKKVSRIKHERLYSSLMEDKINISDDSKSILNQSKLPVYMPLRRSSLGFIPFKHDIFLKKNKPTSFCRRPHMNVKKNESQSNINERENLKNKLQARQHSLVRQNSSLLSKEKAIDEMKNTHYESPSLNESFQQPFCVNQEDCTLSSINSNSGRSTSAHNFNQSKFRSNLLNISMSPSNKSLLENNENILLHLSPSHTNSDVESLNDENSPTKISPAKIDQSLGTYKKEQNDNCNTPETVSDVTNNNLNLSSSGSRSRKQLNFSEQNGKPLSNNNSLNNSFCDTISLSGSENSDLSILMSRDKGSVKHSDTEISDKSLSLLLQELQNKHEHQMEELKQKQIEEQNLLEQQQKRITETILLNLSNSLSPTSISPKSVINEKSPKPLFNYDHVPVNRGLTPVPVSDSPSLALFSSTPGFKQTSAVSSRYSLSSNPSKVVPNKIWYMNNIPAAKFYPKSSYNELEIKAATIIQAGIRGFFVRRLMKTERVQLLIEMIQKSIKCAFEIQQEPSPTLADYEFHSRLVQQITKACYEIHEIFIVFSQKERFSIIAADRLKKLQKSNSSTPVIQPLSVATRRSLQRKYSQSSNENSVLVLRKPHRSRSHTFTSSSLHDDIPRRKRYERSATTYNMKKPQRMSYDSRISNELKRRAPWR